MEEIWKPLSSQGFSKYEISSHGRIKNLQTGYILKGSLFQGYIRSGLTNDDGKLKNLLVHKLVAEVFLQKGDESHVVTHLDGNKANNNVANLRYISLSEACTNKPAKHQGRPVIQKDKQGNFIRRWNKIRDAAEFLGISHTNISTRCNTDKTVAGYLWEYDLSDLEDEEWREAPYEEYELFYVSSLGRIKRENGRITEGSLKRTGYLNFTVYEKGTNKKILKMVHRAVADTFLGKNDDLQINHIDGCKSNNKISNLEYVTDRENTIHAIKTGLRTYDNLKRGRKIAQLDLDDNIIATFESLNDASKETEVAKGNICSVCKGSRKVAGGFKWKYLE